MSAGSSTPIGSPVTVLLALFQGERFLQPQLDSIAGQVDVTWRLVVGDDGSTDGGPQMVKRFAQAHPGKVTMRASPQQGAAANFRDMVQAADGTDHLAFADQDDVWCPHKLVRALQALARIPPDQPAIYCSRVTICDSALRPLGMSRLPLHPPSFRHAMVQNMVQGNTVVLNPAAVALVRQADRLAGKVVMHDWFIYQIVTGAGGVVVYDPEPSVQYRQHDSNVVGANAGVMARFASLRMMMQGQHAAWSMANLAAMTACKGLLTPENRAVLDHFERLVSGSLYDRIIAMRRGGFHRNGALSQMALWLAAILGRV